jgi:hypothetical protein
MGFLKSFAEWVRDLLGRSNCPPALLDTRAADGQVNVALVSGVLGEANARDPRIRRFVKREFTSDLAPARRVRSRRCPPLKGRVALLSIFVGRDGTSWTQSEIARAHKAMIRAAEWIERQAIRWRIAVNLELADTYFAADDDVIEEVELSLVSEENHDALFESDAITKALASATRAAARLGFTDVADLIETIDPRVEADLRIWLFHLRRGGTSLAIAADEAPIPGVTAAICYAREENFPGPLSGPPFSDPVTFVHEILHLCGASDKYGPPLSAFPRHSVTERDVMRLDIESLSRLRVDPATAVEIGWADPNVRPHKKADARRPNLGHDERR